MPITELTDAWVRGVKPTQGKHYEDYWDTKLKGFGCRVLYDGTKGWNVIARRGKERQRFTLGNYPSLKLGEARPRAKDVIAAYKHGRDKDIESLLAGVPLTTTSPLPTVSKRSPTKPTPVTIGESPMANAADEGGLPFGVLATRYIEEWSKIRKGSWRQDVERYHRALKPALEQTPVSQIDTPDVLDLLKLWRDTPSEHDRIKSLVSAVFKWGIEEKLVFKNPTTGIAAAENAKVKKQRAVRQRAYTEGEIRSIWTALDQLSFAEGAFFRFGFFTAQRLGSNLRSAEDSMGDKDLHGTAVRNSLTSEQRKKRARVNHQSDDRGEILFMEWSEIDWDTAWWTCPGQRTKNGLPNRVPLAPEALQLLRDVQADQKKRGISAKYVWIFNAASRIPRWAQKLAQATGVQIDRRPPVYCRNQALKIRTLSGVKDFAQHCVRHTVTTHMTSSGVDEADVAKLLSHISNDQNRNVTSTYNHYAYDTEKRDMIDFWLVKLRMILKGESTATLHYKTFSMQRWIGRQKDEETRIAASTLTASTPEPQIPTRP